MFPVLFEVFGISVTSYGVSKALAALAAWYVLSREFARRGWDRELASTFVIAVTAVGFLGGKLYYLAENPGTAMQHLGGVGFTWYGGFLAGLVTFVVLTRRHALPLLPAAAAAAAPASLAYGIGRIGCLLSGDGTYGQATDLPWGVTFTEGMMPTMVPVHPTPLYETLGALAIAMVLWSARGRWTDRGIVAAYAVLTALARFAVELVRINEPVLLGLTQPQLWSVLLLAAGLAVLGGVRGRLATSEDSQVRSSTGET